MLPEAGLGQRQRGRPGAGWGGACLVRGVGMGQWPLLSPSLPSKTIGCQLGWETMKGRVGLVES